MKSRVCSVEGCERKHYAKDFCSAHYARWRYWEDPAKAIEAVRCWQANNPSKVAEGKRAWNAANPQKRKDLNRASYERLAESEAWREKKRENASKWLAAHRERGNERSRAWYVANRARADENHRIWRAANRERIAAREARRRAQKAGNGGSFTAEDWRSLCDLYGNRCLCCGLGFGLTADHVIPIAKGGRNDISNIQPLCRSCNSQKGLRSTDYRL